MNKIFFQLIVVLTIFLSYTEVHAINLYWISNTTSNWNNTANWSTSDGGIGGAPIPSSGDFVYFTNQGVGNCNLDAYTWTYGIYISSGYTGEIDLNGNYFNPSGTISSNYTCSFYGGTIKDSQGTSEVLINNNGITYFVGTIFNTPINATLKAVNLGGGAFNSPVIIETKGSSVSIGSGGCTFNSTLVIKNSSSTRFRMANSSPNIYNDDATFIQVGTGYFELCHTAIGTQFNGDLIVSCTQAASSSVDKIRIGGNGGTSTLANGKTILIGVGGFISGNLNIKNFTQQGNTAQSLTMTGGADLIIDNCNWGGNVDFRAPSFYSHNSNYSGTAFIEKTGSGTNTSNGGNSFTGNLEIKNSGSGPITFGGSVADVCNSNLELTNTGSHSITFAAGTTGNTVFGNLTVNNSGTSSNSTVNIASTNSSSLSISGNAMLNNSALSSKIYFGNNGDITLTGDLTISNNGGYSYLAFGENSTITVAGSTSVSNSGAGSNSRVYLGNNGDVTFNGALDMVNSSSALNSQIYLSYGPSSSNEYNQNITIKSTNSSSDGFSFGINGGTGTLANSKTITIPGIDVNNFVGGRLYFRNFNQSGNTPQAIQLAPTALDFYSKNSNWGGDVDFRAGGISIAGSTFNGLSYFEKTTGVNSSSTDYGGNTFVGNVIFKNTDNGNFNIGSGVANIFQGNVDVLNEGSGHFYFAHSGTGHSISGNLTCTNSSTGSGTYTNYISHQSSATLNVAGNVIITQNGSANSLLTYLGNSGDVTIGGTLTVNNSGTGNSSEIDIAFSSSSSVSVGGMTSITNSSTAANTNIVYLGRDGDNTYNGLLQIINNAATSNSEVFCNFAASSAGVYNESISLLTSNTNCDGISFGSNGGTGILAANKTISVLGNTPLSYMGGRLYLKNFTQTGSTPQSIALGATAQKIECVSSNWGGDVSFLAASIANNQCVFSGAASFEKTGSSTTNSLGANLFEDDVTYNNQGSGNWNLSYSNGNDYNGNVTYTKSSTGAIKPAYNSTCTFAKSLFFNSNSIIYLGESSLGRAKFDGVIAQSINVIGATPAPKFRDIETRNSSYEITLNTSVTLTKVLDLVQGNLITTAANILRLNDNSIVSTVSNNAFIDGPMVKVGNDAFTFPVGNNGYYAPISISAPTSAASEFEAEYVNNSPNTDGFSSGSLAPSIDQISNSEYWKLNRLVGSNNVKTTLGWNNTRSGSIGSGSLCNIRVLRWDGSKWQNEGNGGVSGSAVTGTVTSGVLKDCSTASTIDLWTNNYPLTLGTDNNFITWDGSNFGGGSGVDGSPNNLDVSRTFKVDGANCTLSANAKVDNVIVSGIGNLTVSANKNLTVANLIENNGQIIIENNASLIQNNSGENTGTGNYIVKRGGNSSDLSFNIWSSPLKQASIINTFSGSNPCDMWVFDSGNQSWKYDFSPGFSTTCIGVANTFSASDVISGGNGIMDVGRGYFVPGSSSSLRSFSGKVNNGNLLVPINETSLGNQPFWDGDDWNLVGNPYPSAIDATSFWQENAVNNTRITGAIYYWDDNQTGTGYNQYSDFASWNLLGGVNSGNSASIPNGTISSGQGFWVAAAATTNLVFTNSMRSSSNSQFFKSHNQVDNHSVWVSLTSPQGYKNNILLGYNNQATDGIDPDYDAPKFVGNAHIKLASIISNLEFSIQGFRSLNIGESKSIPLSVLTDSTGLHNFSLYKTNNLNSNVNVYIRDNNSGEIHDLKLGDFEVVLSANQEYNGRFELIFSYSIDPNNGGNSDKGNFLNNSNNDSINVVTDTKMIENKEMFTVYQPNKVLVLLNPIGVNGDISIMDVSGKVIVTQRMKSQKTIQIANWEGLSSGIYLLIVSSNDELVFSKKVVKL